MPRYFSVQRLAAARDERGLTAFLSRLLLGWYVREVRRVEISEEPSEAIVTYPLA